MSTSKSNSKTVTEVVSCFDDFESYLSPSYDIHLFDLRYGSDTSLLIDYLGYRGCEDLINKAHEEDYRFRDESEARYELDRCEDIFVCAEKDDEVVALWFNSDYDDFGDIITNNLLPFIIHNLRGEAEKHPTEPHISEVPHSANPQLSEVHYPNQEIHLKPFGFSSFNDYLKK